MTLQDAIQVAVRIIESIPPHQRTYDEERALSELRSASCYTEGGQASNSADNSRNWGGA